MTPTLRLALLVDPLTARLRGGGLHAAELARALSARGHAVRLFGAPGQVVRSETTVIDRRSADRDEKTGWKNLLGYKPNAIVAYDALSPTAWLGARLARRLAAPLILVEPGYRAEGAWWGRLFTRIGETLWGAYVRRTASALIALDPVAREQAVREGFNPADIHVMPHGVDLDVFRSGLLSSVVVRHRVRGRVLLCVSPVDLRSGHDVLIGAFAHTVGQRGDWSLVIAAAGSSSRRLRAHAERLGVGDRVHFLPAPTAEELPGLLSCATLTALPGLEDEARGDQVSRIFSSGRPVLASDHPRLRYLIEPGDCGLLARPGDVGAWTEMLRRAAVSPEARRRWGQNARRTAEERLSWSKLAQAFENHVISARLGEESAGAAQASEAG